MINCNEKKFNLKKQTISNLKVREMSVAKGGLRVAINVQNDSDTCWCGPTYWEGCQ
ncbi:MAG: hypothetical protein GY765_16840 [bacterium]|nr:hypothetical protein [bacterium]